MQGEISEIQDLKERSLSMQPENGKECLKKSSAAFEIGKGDKLPEETAYSKEGNLLQKGCFFGVPMEKKKIKLS